MYYGIGAIQLKDYIFVTKVSDTVKSYVSFDVSCCA